MERLITVDYIQHPRRPNHGLMESKVFEQDSELPDCYNLERDASRSRIYQKDSREWKLQILRFHPAVSFLRDRRLQPRKSHRIISAILPHSLRRSTLLLYESNRETCRGCNHFHWGDHIHQLGRSRDNIAWYMVGILKAGTPGTSKQSRRQSRDCGDLL